MADTRISSAAVFSPSAALEALGIVDRSEPGPSTAAQHHGVHGAQFAAQLHHAQNAVFQAQSHAPGGGSGSGLGGAGAGSGAAGLGAAPGGNGAMARVGSGGAGAGTTTAAPERNSLLDRSGGDHRDQSTNDALGLPPDAQVVRVPEGERYRVRAVYDFEATDESALSFHAGDIIEVLTMLPSGWWDGMLDTSRGWFPSNYVEDVEDGELDDADEYDDEDDDDMLLQQQQQQQHQRYVSAVEIGPDGRAIGVRNGSADLIGFDESMARGWGSWADDEQTTSLDDLAMELMADREGDAAAANQQQQQQKPKRDLDNLATADGDETLQAAAHRQQDDQGDAWVPSITPDGRVYYHNTHTGENAWEIPEEIDYASRPPSHKGDGADDYSRRRPDSYDPSKAAAAASAGVRTAGRPRSRASTTSSVGLGGQQSRPTSMQPDDGQFRIPPHRMAGGVPHPWTARLSDDGRTWYYVNQETGEQRRSLPQALLAQAQVTPTSADASAGASASEHHHHQGAISAGAAAGGTASSSSAVVAAAAVRDSANRMNRATSVSTHGTRRSQQDWEDRMRTQLAPLFNAPARPTVSTLVAIVVDAIQLVYEASIAGAAAEEQLLLAREAEADLSTAQRYDDEAVDRARAAQIAVVTAVRALVIALGYVGPFIPFMRGGYDVSASEDIVMERPGWTSDMSLVGSLGLLQITMHGAITGPRGREASESAWTMVIRAAKKLRSVVEAFPDLALCDTPPDRRDNARVRRLVAWFGADQLGDFMSGRFGFGNQIDTMLRPLDQAAVVEVQKLKAEVDAVIRTGNGAPDGGSLEIIRAAAHFRDAVAHIDIAVAIDIDGDVGTGEAGSVPHSDEDARAYADLVSKARHALRDLDEANLNLYSNAAEVFLRNGEVGAAATREKAGQTVAAVFRALSALLVVAQQQAAMLEHGQVRGSLGGRSPAVAARRAAAAAVDMHARTQSSASFESRVSATAGATTGGGGGHARQASQASTDSARQHATPTDAEFLDEDEKRKRRSSRLSRTSQSASGSQTSLVASVSRDGASSSSTSLAYARDSSDTAGSMRANSNRASILKAVPSFLRHRSGSEDQAKKSGKKLAKLLGEESVASAAAQQSIAHRSGRPAPGGTPTTPVGPIGRGHPIPHAMPPPPAPMAPPPAAIRSEPAWYLGTDYPAGEIVFDDRGAVKAGTIRALVVRLTAHVNYDNAFFQAFLLTFRSFVQIDDLIVLLIERYNITAPPDLAPDQLKEWTLRKQTPVRLRVANTFKAWLDNYYVEAEDLAAMGVVEEFAQTTLVANGSELISRQLTQLVDRRRRGDGDAQSRRVVTGGTQPPPQPLLPRASSKAISLLDIQPLEVARQLTIIESACFQRIRPSECLNKAWSDPNSVSESSNLRRAVQVGDCVAKWATRLVVTTKDVKLRSVIVKHLIRVTWELRNLHNFSSFAGLVAAIGGSAVSRMKRTWELIPGKDVRDWNELEIIMDSSKNFARYREMLKTVNPPCVPFLGVYLSALTFIEDGNKDYVPVPSSDGSSTPTVASRKDSISTMATMTTVATSNSHATMSTMVSSVATTNGSTMATSASGNGAPAPMLINFFKRQLTADIIREIQQFQATPYNLATCKPIYAYIEQGIESEREEQHAELYALSLTAEPKEDPNRVGVSGASGRGQW